MNLIKKQIAYSSTVNPEGDIIPAWQAFLQNYVNRESWIAWGESAEERIAPSIECLPSRLYTEVRQESFYEKYLSPLLP